MPYGTLSVSDLLATQATIAQIGEDRAFGAIQDSLDAHNRLTREILTQLADFTTDRQKRYGGAASGTMDEIDEFGTPDAQKVVAGVTVGFPLRLYGRSVQWTRKYFQNASAMEFAAEFLDIQDSDLRNMHLQIRRAIFHPTNTTFVDKLVDNVTIYPKALINADSTAMPVGPNGETFDGSTHTHYLGTATLTAVGMTAAIETVVEHSAMGQPMVYINRAQETAVRALTGFTAYTPVQIIPATTTASVRGDLDTAQLYNRAIGIFGNQAAEIWVKPWVPANWMFIFLAGAPKPLIVRERTLGSMGLVVAADDEEHPLRARTLENEFGVAVFNRVNGAVYYIANATYAEPTLTL